MSKIIKGIFVSLSCILFFASCQEDEIGTRLNSKLLTDKICKNMYVYMTDSMDYSDTISRITYYYNDTTKLLRLLHENAGFNCCPTDLYCKVNLQNDTLYIQELEYKAMCDCNCLYDLEIQISNLTAKKYYLKFIEPYIHNETELSFEVDLTHHKNGSFSVVRKNYPWGTSVMY